MGYVKSYRHSGECPKYNRISLAICCYMREKLSQAVPYSFCCPLIPTAFTMIGREEIKRRNVLRYDPSRDFLMELNTFIASPEES